MKADAARSSRLEAVAQSFLRPEPATACQVVVASSGDGTRLARASRALYDASTSMGFETGLLGGNGDAGQPEPGAGERPLWIVEAGGVHEEWLARLSPPSERGPELLVWVHADGSAWLRESYLFGMLRWSLAPAKSVALVEDPPAELLEHLRELNAPEAEVVASSSNPAEPAAERALMRQILQSAMARASHRPRPSIRLGRSPDA